MRRGMLGLALWHSRAGKRCVCSCQSLHVHVHESHSEESFLPTTAGAKHSKAKERSFTISHAVAPIHPTLAALRKLETQSSTCRRRPFLAGWGRPQSRISWWSSSYLTTITSPSCLVLLLPSIPQTSTTSLPAPHRRYCLLSAQAAFVPRRSHQHNLDPTAPFTHVLS